MLQCTEEMFAVAAVAGLGVVVTSHGDTSRRGFMEEGADRRGRRNEVAARNMYIGK